MTHHDRNLHKISAGRGTPLQNGRASATRVRFLTAREERDLLRAWQESGDEAALEKLAASHRPLVVKLAKKSGLSDGQQDDLVQEGLIGLIEAAGRFDLSRNVRFATYAKWWIEAAIRQFSLHNNAIVRIVRSADDKALFYNLNRLRHRLGLRGPLNDDDRREIARILGVRTEAVERMERFLEGRDRSTQETFPDSDGLSLEDRLPDPSPSPEDLAVASNEHDFRMRCLNKAMGDLSERERIIVEARRLREDRTMLRDLGKRFGISKERVRQIEKAAVEKLNAATLGYAAAGAA